MEKSMSNFDFLKIIKVFGPFKSFLFYSVLSLSVWIMIVSVVLFSIGSDDSQKLLLQQKYLYLKSQNNIADFQNNKFFVTLENPLSGNQNQQNNKKIKQQQMNLIQQNYENSFKFIGLAIPDSNKEILLPSIYHQIQFPHVKYQQQGYCLKLKTQKSNDNNNKNQNDLLDDMNMKCSDGQFGIQIQTQFKQKFSFSKLTEQGMCKDLNDCEISCLQQKNAKVFMINNQNYCDATFYLQNVCLLAKLDQESSDGKWSLEGGCFPDNQLFKYALKKQKIQIQIRNYQDPQAFSMKLLNQFTTQNAVKFDDSTLKCQFLYVFGFALFSVTLVSAIILKKRTEIIQLKI